MAFETTTTVAAIVFGTEEKDINVTISKATDLNGFDSSVCPTFDKFSTQLITELTYWLEGFLQASIAVVGIVFNLISSLILASKSMRNAFNLLLIALAFFDTCYLFGAILESFRKGFGIESDIHTLLFPYLLYPGYFANHSFILFPSISFLCPLYFLQVK